MFAVIHIPDFPLQVVQRHGGADHETPMVLVDAAGAKPTIYQVNKAAAALCIAPGMSLPQAMARQAGLVVRHRSLAQEEAAQEALLQIAFAFSPAVETTAPGICTLDLAGLNGMQGEKWKSWADNLKRCLQAIQFEARIGLASRPLVAQYAALFAEPILYPNREEDFLEKLPVAAAGSAPEIVDLLRRWGVHTLGAVQELGLTALMERLGGAGQILYERSTGQRNQPLQCVHPSPLYVETIDFEQELEMLEPLLDLLRGFLEKICFRQELAGMVTQQLELELRFAKGSGYQRQFTIPAPTAQVKPLWRVLQTHLENLTTEQPISGVRLCAQACPPIHEQLSLFEGALRDPNHFSLTLGRLEALLGPGRIGFPKLENTHRPDAVAMNSVVPTETPQTMRRRARHGLVLRRFRPPVQARLTLEVNGPTHVQSEVLSGAIKGFLGPWRSSGQWWEKTQWRREEWDVESNNGIVARIYREGNEWYVEGFYD